MALDLDAIRKRLSGLQNQTGKQNNLWKPEPGKQTIRIVPYQFNKDNPFIELFFHYGLNGKTFMSPVTHGEADPVVEFAEKLKATGNRDDWQMSRKLEPKMRTYVPVLVRGQESEGVKLWGFGKTVYQELLSFIADPDYGDITDLNAGRDVTVEFMTAAELGKQYPQTTIRIKPNQTPATENKEIAQKIMDGQKDANEIFKKVSYDELKEQLAIWLDPEQGETDSETSVGTGTPAAAQPTSTNTKKVDDVNSAFDELFNN